MRSGDEASRAVLGWKDDHTVAPHPAEARGCLGGVKPTTPSLGLMGRAGAGGEVPREEPVCSAGVMLGLPETGGPTPSRAGSYRLLRA